MIIQALGSSLSLQKMKKLNYKRSAAINPNNVFSPSSITDTLASLNDFSMGFSRVIPAPQ